ncbi:MAG: acyl carrier protein [Lachnospiraceae bacterium]|nr:acyl carrier protein [Lachnospiraceae bacterium]
MEEKIKALMNEIAPGSGDYEGDNVLESGIMDSLQVVELVVTLEEEFDIEIDPELVTEENFKNLKAVVSMMENLLGGN